MCKLTKKNENTRIGPRLEPARTAGSGRGPWPPVELAGVILAKRLAGVAKRFAGARKTFCGFDPGVTGAVQRAPCQFP